ncbi:MAG TPA: transglutaminase-like domain-containing protein, partial [bacterium]|nr:transglutaminase-like domain-containing protein [bacterium]
HRRRFTVPEAVAAPRLARGGTEVDAEDLAQADIRLVGTTSTGKGFLFLPWRTVEVEGDFEGVTEDDLGTLQIYTDASETSETLRDRFTLSKGDSWRAHFERVDRTTEDPEAAPLKGEDLARFTQLPDSTPGRLLQLGRSLVRDKDDPAAAAREVQTFLQGRKSYTLDPPVLAADEVDAIDHWLFESEEGGHCEFFSTAMAVLLRAGGVPSRVITGFAPGSYNLAKGAWVIRGKDAHAWVEVYLPGHGWVPHDPTPSNWSEDVVDAFSGVTSRVSRALEQYFIYDPRGFWTRDFPRHVAAAWLTVLTTARELELWASEPAGPINRGMVLALFGLPALLGLGLTLTFARAGVPFGDFATLRHRRVRDWSWRQYQLLQRRLQKLDDDLPGGLTLPELADYLDGDRPHLAQAVRTLAPPFHHFHYGTPGTRPGWLARLKRGWRGVGRYMP